MTERPAAAASPPGLGAGSSAGLGSEMSQLGVAAKIGDPFRGDDVGEVGVHDSVSVADPSQDAIERMRYTET